jgi:hypothetical protein
MGTGGGVFLETSGTSFEISDNAKVYGSNADSNKNTADGGGQALFNQEGGTVTINGIPKTGSAIDVTIPKQP